MPLLHVQSPVGKPRVLCKLLFWYPHCDVKLAVSDEMLESKLTALCLPGLVQCRVESVGNAIVARNGVENSIHHQCLAIPVVLCLELLCESQIPR